MLFRFPEDIFSRLRLSCPRLSKDPFYRCSVEEKYSRLLRGGKAKHFLRCLSLLIGIVDRQGNTDHKKLVLLYLFGGKEGIGAVMALICERE
ncbi:hypothetical protein NPIL_266911 [Nephila pilipes]|uniref:Uncharacterized protein n=1 Tax=Nephila pilipes TaxID=299642 RepID=A0A8X6Q100_NEPPI|nr:hypothetical protein NPIL_266911 [Nephila pilipes]